MSIVEKVYEHSPIFLQNAMCSMKGLVDHFSRYGREYRTFRQFYEDFDKLSLNEQLEYQRKEMIRLISYAKENSPFYSKLYEDIDLSQINTIEDLKLLPIVTKEMLRDHIEEVITIKDGVESHTGGTTGKSLVVKLTVSDSKKRMALLDHFKHRVGFEHLKMKRATFNGKHIIPFNQKKNVYWRYNAACKQMIYSSFHLTEDKIGYYIESLNRYKPDAIDGFFTSMLDIADYVERHNVELKFKPIALFPTSETVTEDGRIKLERVFGCKVYNQYASSEGAPFITACKNQVLHMELSSGIFEHISDDSDEVLVTSFTTYGTPLIRYSIGDCVKFGNPSISKCDCGLKGPIVEEISGRRLDFLYRADGAKINAGNVSNLLKNVPNAVIRAQFIQEELSNVLLKLQVDKERFSSAYEALIQDEFKHVFGEETDLKIVYCDSIERAESGKYRFIINNVKMK